MKPVLLFVAAFSPLLGAPALAQTAAVPATAVASAAPIAPAVPADEKMICHVEEETGTRLGGHKECHTKQQWDAIARDERQDLARRSAQKIQNGGG